MKEGKKTKPKGNGRETKAWKKRKTKKNYKRK
jgi:hypothetical protein